ncbi:MAG: bifunctional phosphopantothenoylcysteine decarboxylase/phosphopantothenate--cysteine ligase CoaBC [Leptolyngbyaceae cyanobacterium]
MTKSKEANDRPLESTLKGRVVLGLSGGIAAYKLCEVASALAKADIEVRAVLTEAAQQFITPLTLATLCRHPAYTDSDFWQPPHQRPLHIQLGEWADLLVLAPLTAHTLGKLSHGLADNLLTNMVLASTCPILVAPAMNTDMWQQPAVQHNWRQWQANPRVHTVGPGQGRLACDRVGTGRMAEPHEILTAINTLLLTQGRQDLAGKHILISAGSTHEHLDPVRFIGNPATGKMGVALAQSALYRGAQVTLIHGPMAPADLQGLGRVQTKAVVNAAELQQAMETALPQADWIIMAAAVADVRPQYQANHKLPKADLPQQLPLEPVPDIAARLCQMKAHHQKIIGFAAQTGDIIAPAQRKLAQKGLDAIVANPIDQPQSGFGSYWNQATILTPSHQHPIPICPKWIMAHHIYDVLLTLK